MVLSHAIIYGFVFRRVLQNCEKRLLLVVSSRPSVRGYVCPSVRKEQIGSHWTDFQQILYLSILRKSIQKPQVSLKTEKNNVYFTWRLTYTFDDISLISSRMKNGSDKSCRENQNTHFMFNKFLSKIVPFMRQCGKLLYSGAGHRRQYGACALNSGYRRQQTHTHNM